MADMIMSPAGSGDRPDLKVSPQLDNGRPPNGKRQTSGSPSLPVDPPESPIVLSPQFGQSQEECRLENNLNLLALGLQQQVIAAYQDKVGNSGYSINSDLWSNSIDTKVKEGKNQTSVSTSWNYDKDKIEIKTSLHDPARGTKLSSLAVAPVPSNTYVTFSTRTRDENSGYDLSKDLTDSIVKCDGGRHRVELHTTHRTPENAILRAMFTNILDKGETRTTLKTGRPDYRVLQDRAGTIQANSWGWVPFVAWNSFKSKD